MKICSSCKEDKSLDDFYKSAKDKFGVRSICKICDKEHNKLNYQNKSKDIIQNVKNYYKNNSNKVKEYQKIYTSNNKEKVKNNQKEYHSKNKDKIYSKTKKYNNLNRDKINSYRNNRKNDEPLFKLSCNLRSRISKIFKNGGYKKLNTTKQLLGVEYNEVIKYLENKLYPEMNWPNYGIIWEIDHIKPLSLAQNEDELKELCHFTNLQPLFKTTDIANMYGYNDIGNRNKYNKYE